MAPTVIHARAETKPLEHRAAVTPTIAKKLVDAGYEVHVERSPLSIFKDAEYEGTGATLVPTGSWVDAPSDHIIVGLKELPEEDFPLKHTVGCVWCMHIYQSNGAYIPGIKPPTDHPSIHSMSNSPTATKVKGDGTACSADSPAEVARCWIWSFWRMNRVVVSRLSVTYGTAESIPA
jgi:saccharopine dehydrogenase (NAD+, L-lysine-forming)